MAATTKAQTDAADWLLRRSVGESEDSIRQRVCNLLDSLSIEYEMSYRSPFASGSCDIYLPRRRTIIETKVVGGADDPNRSQPRRSEESPKQQLERYLHAEIDYELQASHEDAERPWSGILTDGKVWHVWRYANERNAVSSTVGSAFRPSDANSLIDHLNGVLAGDLVGKPWIPANPRSIFERNLTELGEIFEELPVRVQSSTETKRALWLEMLRISSMEPESDLAELKLFVAHSFLVALARGVIQVLANPAAVPSAEEALGGGFVAWIVETARGRQWAEQLFRQIFSFEWRRRPGDVLRPLYEQFVDAKDRKVYGEFYTPDWLAQLLVREVCDEEWCRNSVEQALLALRRSAELTGVGILDPTCGSGTFLYHAALRILSSPQMETLSNTDKSAVVCMLVNGIDIHPVAAEISRATLLRALPSEPPHGESALRVHEGDALLVHGDDESSVFRPLNGELRIETPKGREVLLPRALVNRPTFVDDMRRLIAAASRGADLPADLLNVGTDRDEKAMIDCHRQFIEIVREEESAVWTWYIRNITGPHRLSETKVDRIVANPPWVKMADIQALNRKRTIEEFASGSAMNLWSSGKQAPHFDIAQLFVKRCRQLYLIDPLNNPGAWLVKKSAMNGGNWAMFRRWHKTFLRQTLDLEPIQPFGGGDARRCCVLFEARKSELRPRARNNLLATIAEGEERPLHSDQLEDVLGRLSIRAAPPPIPQRQSDFEIQDGRCLFKQGATITPKVLTVVNRLGKGAASNNLNVTTVRSDDARWSNLEPQQGDVPTAWVRDLVVSKKVLPFALNRSWNLYAIVPVTEEGAIDKQAPRNNAFWRELDEIYQEQRGRGKNTPANLIDQIDYSSKLSTQLKRRSHSGKSLVVHPSSADIMRGYRLQATEEIIDKQASQNNAFWRELDEIYQEQRGGGKNTPANLIDRIDYGSSLSTQLARRARSGKSLVVYPSSADIMRGCRLHATEEIIDSTLYSFVASTPSEAAYLVSLLNAPCLRQAFAQSRESGRDMHLHPWRKIPIRRYDKRNSLHAALAQLAVKAETAVEAWISTTDETSRLGQVGLSTRVRSLLDGEGIFDEIDEIVRRLLPKQYRSRQ